MTKHNDTFGFRLPAELERQISEAAEARLTSSSQYARQAILERLRRDGERKGPDMDWVNEVSTFIEDLERQRKSDGKNFIGTRDNVGVGLRAAKAARANLQALATRVGKLIVTP